MIPVSRQALNLAQSKSRGNRDVAEVLVYNNGGRMPPPPEVPDTPPCARILPCGHVWIRGYAMCKDPGCMARREAFVAVCMLAIMACIVCLYEISRWVLQ